MLQILQIRLPITSLFEKRRHTVTPTHFCLNFPLSFLHLPQSCDILIPGPFSYPLPQLHCLFFRLPATAFKIIIIWCRNDNGKLRQKWVGVTVCRRFSNKLVIGIRICNICNIGRKLQRFSYRHRSLNAPFEISIPQLVTIVTFYIYIGTDINKTIYKTRRTNVKLFRVKSRQFIIRYITADGNDSHR
jgi:hypothetical protein